MKPYIAGDDVDDTEELIVDADTGRVIPVGDGPPLALDRTPIVTARRLRHGLAAVLIPRGLTGAQEDELRASLGLPPRPSKRRRTA
jgi:hypothetical protein